MIDAVRLALLAGLVVIMAPPGFCQDSQGGTAEPVVSTSTEPPVSLPVPPDDTSSTPAPFAGPSMPEDPGRKVISTPDAPEGTGHCSQAVRVGNLVFLAGQVAVDPVTNELNTNAPIEEQTALVLNHIKAVLSADGLTLDDVVATTVYMTDLTDFDRMNTVYATFFVNGPPTRTAVQVAALPHDAKVQISAIAVRP